MPSANLLLLSHFITQQAGVECVRATLCSHSCQRF